MAWAPRESSPATTAEPDGTGSSCTFRRSSLQRPVEPKPPSPRSDSAVEQRPFGLVRIALKKAYTDGTVAVDMDPLSLLCRLATSVPPPRLHTARYAGVLAAASPWRPRIAPMPPTEEPAAASGILPRRSSEPVQGPPELVSARNEPPRGGLLTSGLASDYLRAADAFTLFLKHGRERLNPDKRRHKSRLSG